MTVHNLETQRQLQSQREVQETKELDLREHARLVQPRGKPATAKAGRGRKEEQPRKDALAAARSKAAQARPTHLQIPKHTPALAARGRARRCDIKAAQAPLACP